MKFFLRISVLLLLVTGTLTQDDFDLYDAIDHDAATTEKPKPKTTEKPKINGGGGGFGDSDLLEVGGGGDYKPDANGGGGAHPDQDSHGAADQPQEAGSGQIAGIVSAIGVALLGAASSYFAYQKKKLCFKIQGGADPEKGHQVTQSEPQVFSTLLSTS